MITDFHSHTRFSACGADEPEDLVLEMIKQGVEVFGITDHNYGIFGREEEYLSIVSALKEKYKDKITLYCGVEIATLKCLTDRLNKDFSAYDYCLIEQIDSPDSFLANGFFDYAKNLGIKTGIAHTDLFSYAQKLGVPAREFFLEMKELGIFWELNVNYDYTHRYREHAYVKDFFINAEKQEIIKEIGLELSVGFDGHRLKDYDIERVKSACEFLQNNRFNMLKGF